MPIRRLGSAGPEVGAIGLGCMGMSWGYNPSQRDDARSERVIRRALELGVTLIDTADSYGPFVNEELVGRALAGRRERAVLATKVGVVLPDSGKFELGLDARPERIRRAIDDSLRRLQTDHVDLYQLHRVDPAVPLEETWGAMAEVMAAGKARALGLSEVSVDELERAHAIHPVASVQSELSLWTRDPLPDVLPWCRDHGVGFIAYSPLGRGFLTGRIAAGDIEPADYRADHPRFTDEAISVNRKILERVIAIAEAHDAAPGQVALAWVLAQGEMVVPIPGTKRIEYLEENAAAAGITLTETELAELDALPAPLGARRAAR